MPTESCFPSRITVSPMVRPLNKETRKYEPYSSWAILVHISGWGGGVQFISFICGPITSRVDTVIF